MRAQLQSDDDLFEKMADQMGTIMDSMLGEMNSRNYFRSAGRDSWEPHLNFYETPQRFIVCVELAGMRREQIDIRVEENLLHVRGERPKPEMPDVGGDVSVCLMEIDSGRFHRKVPIPGSVATDGITAAYRNGYVWIIMPRVADQ
jgi:HSP20 family protein